MKNSLLLVFTALSCSLFATHGVAIDMNYKCLGANQYEITVVLYRDCNGASAPNGIMINFTSVSCNQSGSQYLSKSGVNTLNVLCNASQAKIACRGGSLPGFEEHKYVGVITLPANCNDWKVSYSLCCRNNAITNLRSAANHAIYTEAMINNLNGGCNNSATFTNAPAIYVCDNMLMNYNHGIREADGDSLAFELIEPMTYGGTPIPFSGTYNKLSQFQTQSGIIFNSNSGQVSAIPMGIQQAIISFRIKEYDKNGVLKGYVTRDMQIVVMNCNGNLPPRITGIDSIANKYTDTICVGDNYSFNIFTSDSNVNDSTSLRWNGAIAGAKFFTSYQGNNARGHFNWTPTIADVGNNYFTLTSRDNACPIIALDYQTYNIVVVRDSVVAICNDTTIYVDTNGIAKLDTSFVGNNSFFGRCNTTYSFSKDTFSCADIGMNSVTFKIGNQSSCTSNILVLDTIPPTIICKNIKVSLNANLKASVFANQLIDNMFDNCSLEAVWTGQGDFNCNDIGFNNVQVNIRDLFGNMNSCTAIVKVIDTSAFIHCKDTTIYTTWNNSSIGVPLNQLVNNIYGGCYDTVWADTTQFNCDNLGLNKIEVYKTHKNDTLKCISNIYVLDTIPPILNCKNVNAYLDINGFSTINKSSIVNLVSDNCEVDSVWLEKISFDCKTIGRNQLIVYASDVSGNIDSCVSYIQIIDTIPPITSCQDDTVYLNANGIATISTNSVLVLATDNCKIRSVNLSKNRFDCSDIGSQSITLTATDISGNHSNCSSKITVIDTINPKIRCQDTTLYLPLSGSISLNQSMLVLNSFDNCHSDLILSKAYLDCSDIGSNNITVTLKDKSNNSSSCISKIQLIDTLAPIIQCHDTSIYIDPTGIAKVSTQDILSSVNENCKLDSLWINQKNYTCSDTGKQYVTIYARDVFNNIDSCIATVDVRDTLSSLIICKDTSIILNAMGVFTIDPSYIIQSVVDNCYPDTMWISQANFTCADLGQKSVNAYNLDESGNLSSCTAKINVSIKLDSGKNGAKNESIKVCKSDNSIDLFNLFSPRPQTNGSFWLNNKKVLNPRTDSSQVFTYIMPTSVCTYDTLKVKAIVNPLPKPKFRISDNEVCLGQEVTLYNLNCKNNRNCIWDIEGSLVNSCNDSLKFTSKTVGFCNIQLVIEDRNGCIDSINHKNILKVNANPIADFSYDYTNDNLKKSIPIHTVPFLNFSQGAISYSWLVNNEYQSNSFNYTHQFDIIDGLRNDITLIATNQYKCRDTVSKKMEFKDYKKFYTPNVFTPDGDGRNDVFLPVFRGNEIPIDYSLSIYDRWGNEIYTNSNYSNGWNGFYQGKLCKQDTYIWKMISEGEAFTGHITLLH